jgi:RNA polymerase sigma-70 factor (ECF subfamily)
MHSAEADLLERLRARDESAFEELVRHHHALLLGVARSIIRDAEAEEVCQDAWISAYKAIGRFEGRSSLRTWLTRIVINEARMRLRRGGRELSLDALPEGAEPFEGRFATDGHWSHAPLGWRFDGPEELLSEEDLRRCMEKTMGILPANQRLVLEMRDIQGMELEEICNSLELGASNVRVLLHRARTRLFQMIDTYTETGTC